MSLVIETLRSSKTPWEIFQEVYADSRVCFFLDSPCYAPPNQTFSYIGTDPAVEIRLERETLHVRGEVNGKYPAARIFPVLKELFRKYQVPPRSACPFFTGGFVGYFGYETADLCDKIKFREKPGPDTSRAYWGFFRNVIVYDHRRRLYHLAVNPAKGAAVCDQLEKLKNYFKKPPGERAGHFRLGNFTAEMNKARFKAMVEKAKRYIVAGDIYQANLSQRFSFGYEGSSLELYGKLRAINPSPFSCFLKAGDLEIVSASPERLIRKKGRLCETRPIAGTCPARGASKRLAEWRKNLLQNEKEKAEHLMLVDLERNDLGRVCDFRSVKVEEFMVLERYSHVVHIVSRVTGRLRRGKDAFDVIRAMFPGGTITGCPKIRCMQIIDELEPVGRGIYTGSLGHIDLQGDMDLNIVIRTILLKNGKGHLQVGAGIVYDSDPEKEYEETLHKAEALRQALREAGR
ncbi:MAG TPA: anthranilate synthase component I family protein [Candidatus Omnitrophota bacterium]|nr:anthranilate synthase component I family protein [Candidatus Omnitrophota bacterium]